MGHVQQSSEIIANELASIRHDNCNDNVVREDMETDKDREGDAIAPDGGWAWVVCAACFMSHVLTDGLFYSFGVLFVELLDFFKSSKGETVMIASLSTGVCLFGGPVFAMLTNKCGCRVTAAVGSVIASGSLVVSVFAQSILFLYFSLGIVFGIGVGMIYLPSIVSVSRYFEKKRAFATGIGVSGAGIGTFILSPLTSLLITAYTWQGALLIQAGLVLNCLVCAAVYRPIDIGERSSDAGRETGNKGNQDERCQLGLVMSDIEHGSQTTIGDSRAETTKESADESVESSAVYKQASEQPRLNVNKETIGSGQKQTLKHSTLKEIFSRSYNQIRTSFDVSIFRNVAYNMFLASNFLYSLGYYIPYIYLPDTARTSGIDEFRGSLLISAIGITNTVGRVLFGFVSDRKGVNKLVLYATALAICGAATCVGPLLSSFEMLLVYCIVFGAFSGVTSSLTSVLLSDILGIQRLADGLGVSNFFAGIASFSGLPLAGWLYDVSGSYLISYVAAGTSIFISGVMLYPLPYIEKKFQQNTAFVKR